ncbi:MAG: SRPBCC domain-containing protein [Polyangiaceae bacterium]
MNAKTTKRFFSRETEVAIDIDAEPSAVWALLTDAKAYPTWNSTVIAIEGEIAEGSRIALRSTLDPKRTFKLRVKKAQAPELLVWGDAMGTRTYTIAPRGPRGATFTMHEKIGGPMFPLFAGMIPPFDESFDRFAADLKKKAEARA